MLTPFDTLPSHWQEWVQRYAKEKTNGKWDRLAAYDFNGSVKIRFEDGSMMLFEHAFYAVDQERKELAVFTEHCGYYVVPLSKELEYSYNVWAQSPGDPSNTNEKE